MYPMLQRTSSVRSHVQAVHRRAPAVGVSRPHSMRMTVDFPAPLGPRKPKISPFETRSDTWSTATNAPKVFTSRRFGPPSSQASFPCGADPCPADALVPLFARKARLPRLADRRRGAGWTRGSAHVPSASLILLMNAASSVAEPSHA